MKWSNNDKCQLKPRQNSYQIVGCPVSVDGKKVKFQLVGACWNNRRYVFLFLNTKSPTIYSITLNVFKSPFETNNN